MVPASDANLRSLYISGEEAAELLLAAARLRQLSPALALDESITGAVVARATHPGALELRRVARVAALHLRPDGGPKHS